MIYFGLFCGFTAPSFMFRQHTMLKIYTVGQNALESCAPLRLLFRVSDCPDAESCPA